VVIGGNDWGALGRSDAAGQKMFPWAADRLEKIQREYAYRFGVNLMMHVLRAIINRDQVHVPNCWEGWDNDLSLRNLARADASGGDIKTRRSRGLAL